MYIVFNTETGYSDESMRFASLEEADAWIIDQSNWYGITGFGIRYEED